MIQKNANPNNTKNCILTVSREQVELRAEI